MGSYTIMKSKHLLLIIAIIISGSLLIPIIVFIPDYESGKTIYFETLSKGSNGGIGKHNYLIIDSQIMWEQTWNQTFKHKTNPGVPVIDFTENIIIAVYYGWEATGGYSIEITKISESFSEFNVYVEETSPSLGSGLTQATTMPYHIVKTQKLTMNVNFITISN